MRSLTSHSCVLFVLAFASIIARGLDWSPASGHRSAALAVPRSGKTGFTRLQPEITGITFTNHLSDAAAANNRILENGSGVALGDVDGDGWCDVYFCRLEGDNTLYRNLGNWKFADIAAGAGVACPGQYSNGAVFTDIDGDGDLDLLVTSLGGGTRLFLNDGRARFVEAGDSGVFRRFCGTSMALADIESDGDLDLYVANYRTTTYKDAPPGVKAEAYLVDGKVVVTPEDRFEGIVYKNGGIGLVEKGEPDVLYINKGGGRFGPVSWTGGAFADEAGKALKAPPMDWALTAAFRDLNQDGSPDLYLCNDFSFSRDKVWLNEAGRRFQAIPKLALRNMSMSSMAVDFADINRDGYDDFIVMDMLSRDHRSRHRQRANLLRGKLDLPIGDPEFRPENPRNTLHLNRGDGTYAEIAQLAGLEASEWSWSVVFLDVDLDGFEDVLVTNGNDHDSLDADVLREIATPGRMATEQEHFRNLLKFPRLETANLAFRNHGDLTFSEVGAAWGFNTAGISHGMALADLDNDGDLDVVMNNLHSAAGVYRNESDAPRIAVRLKGARANTRGIGAKITVSPVRSNQSPVNSESQSLITSAATSPNGLGILPTQTHEMMSGGRYLSGDDAMRVFAAGMLTNRFTIEVRWRGGKRSIITNAEPNRIFEIDEAIAVEVNPNDQSQIADRKSQILQPFFEDASDRIRHVHRDDPFDDFAVQSLLPRRLSQLGPGVAWHDLDGDGSDDLIIGSGRGGQLSVLRNDGKGGFAASDQPPLNQSLARDLTSVLGWQKAPGQPVILAGTSNLEDGSPRATSIRHYDLNAGTVHDAPGGQAWTIGPACMADIDGDGDLDLFAGGRVLPGRYPEPVASLIYRNAEGVLRPDESNNREFEKVGLVSGAVWSDLTGDGFPELVLACEWGPIRIFRNERGKLVPWNPPIGLVDNSATERSRASGVPSEPQSQIAYRKSQNLQPSTFDELTGWWNGVTTGDLDGDGRLDIIASNWGRNTKQNRHLDRAIEVYYGDFNGLGRVELVEAYFDAALSKVVPATGLDVLSQSLPFVAESFPSYRAYGAASVAQVLGDKFASANKWSAAALDSMIFLNRGDRFEALAMPVEAQFAPAFGVVVADFDGDGNEDVFLSQNFFAVELETSRYDAGRGLWLRGDGQGGLVAMPGQESGVRAYGEQRGCAVADFDGDRRVDLVVAQNSNATKLYRNVRARPGLRVRLAGVPGNSAGVGATIRLQATDRLGPAREVRAGGGYWSQDSAVQVMNAPTEPTHAIVRWPGGRTTRSGIPAGATEIEVSMDGDVRSGPKAR